MAGGFRDTGFARADASDDFMRARRAQTMRRIGSRLGRGDVDVILPYEEVIAELGRVGERDLGLKNIALDSILGTVGRQGGGFDRQFRPTSSQVRGRWERIAGMMRRGESLPPISVYRVGDAHFVRDGHHRVSVARALGRDDIDAMVTEVVTRVGMDGGLRMADLPLKGHERLFRERVPLSRSDAGHVNLSDPWKYGDLAEGVEAWGFRAAQERPELLDRKRMAKAWFDEEFVPVVSMLRGAGLVQPGETAADAYERLGGERYRLMRTVDWNEEIVSRLRRG